MEDAPLIKVLYIHVRVATIHLGEEMIKQASFEFYWLSLLGISVILFLGYGLLNLLVGIFVPFLSRRTGTAGFAPSPLSTSC